MNLPHGLGSMAMCLLPESPGLHSPWVELATRGGVPGAESTCEWVSVLRGQPGLWRGPGYLLFGAGQTFRGAPKDSGTQGRLGQKTYFPAAGQGASPAEGAVSLPRRQGLSGGAEDVRDGEELKEKMPVFGNHSPQRWGPGGGGWVQEPHYQLRGVGVGGWMWVGFWVRPRGNPL